MRDVCALRYDVAHYPSERRGVADVSVTSLMVMVANNSTEVTASGCPVGESGPAGSRADPAPDGQFWVHFRHFEHFSALTHVCGPLCAPRGLWGVPTSPWLPTSPP